MKRTRKNGLKKTKKVMTAHLRDRDYLNKMKELRQLYPGRFSVLQKPKIKLENEKPQKYRGFLNE